LLFARAAAGTERNRLFTLVRTQDNRRPNPPICRAYGNDDAWRRRGLDSALRRGSVLLAEAESNPVTDDVCQGQPSIPDVMDSSLIKDLNHNLLFYPKRSLSSIAAQKRQSREHCLHDRNGWRIQAE